MTRRDYKEIITVDPKVRDGAPCIRGLPIAVSDITSRILAGVRLPQILTEYPQLTREDILAVAEFSADQPFGRYLF